MHKILNTKKNLINNRNDPSGWTEVCSTRAILGFLVPHLSCELVYSGVGDASANHTLYSF